MKRKIDTKKVKQLFEKSGLTQKELVNRTGMSIPTVSYAINGKRDFPFDYVFEIASIFEVDPLSITIIISNDTKQKAS